jgi:hypothetical protein
MKRRIRKGGKGDCAKVIVVLRKGNLVRLSEDDVRECRWYKYSTEGWLVTASYVVREKLDSFDSNSGLLAVLQLDSGLG